MVFVGVTPVDEGISRFLDASFRNHPCIAPVITLHLFRSQVTKTAFSEAIKRLEGCLNALEKNGPSKPATKGGKTKAGTTMEERKEGTLTKTDKHPGLV